MHELSVIMSIVEMAEHEVKKHHAKGVDEINLEIGTLAGIELDALNFVWDVAVKNTVLESAKKDIQFIQAISKCQSCLQHFHAESIYDQCPHCGNLFNELTCGRELRVHSLVVS